MARREICWVRDPLRVDFGTVVAIREPGSIWSALEQEGPIFRVSQVTVPTTVARAFAEGRSLRFDGSAVVIEES